MKTRLGATRHVIGVSAPGRRDPDGMRGAAVLSAYFHLADMQGWCRQRCYELTVLGVIWALLSRLVPGISGAELGAWLGALGAVAAGAKVAEWRATRRLGRMVASLRCGVQVE